MSTSTNPAFVLIHGAWHSAKTWDKIVPLLADNGYAAVAIDLPGAGSNAKDPTSYGQRPLDLTAFSTEPSPNAGITQDERNEATLNAIKEASELGNGQVILVGHSLGGLTVSAVAQTAPEQLHAVVYLTAFLIPGGMSRTARTKDTRTKDRSRGEISVRSLVMADPQAIGAQRLDPKSEDAEYVARMRAVFYTDVSDADFEIALGNLHPDEPAQPTTLPSPISADKFGTVARHYIRCTQDQAITLNRQDKMIRSVDDQLGTQTIVHTLESSHSPFYSQPENLVDILAEIAQSAGE